MQHELPEPGAQLMCLLCAYVKPWGVFDSKTGAAICVECREGARGADVLRQEIQQAHGALDLLNIPRTEPGSGEGVETLTLLGRLRIVERHFGEDATPIACKARASASDPPQDCDWPFCGCDPRADKVLATLQECGLEIVKPVTIGTESAKAFLKSAVDKCAFGSPLGIVPFSAFESIAEVMRDYAALGIHAPQPPSRTGASE